MSETTAEIADSFLAEAAQAAEAALAGTVSVGDM